MEWIRLARRQHALITRAQLIALGASHRGITRELHRGRLERTACSGVYRVAGAPFTPESAAWFAVLSTRSPLSFVSAAQTWDVDVPLDGMVHITRLDRRRLDWPRGVRVHRVALAPESVTERYGLPVTTRTETLLDCLGSLRLADARRLLDRAVHLRQLEASDIEARLENMPKRWGNRQLRLLLPQAVDGAVVESERRLHRLLRSARISGWVSNLVVVAAGERYEIDVAFPAKMLAIEIDGFDYHRRERFQRDRTKQNALTRAGWTVLRFTWHDLEERSSEVLAVITAVLAA